MNASHNVTKMITTITTLFCLMMFSSVAMAGPRHKNKTSRKVTKSKRANGNRTVTRTRVQNNRGKVVRRNTTVTRTKTRTSPTRRTTVTNRRVQTHRNRTVRPNNKRVYRRHHNRNHRVTRRVYRTEPVTRVSTRGNVRTISTCYWYGGHQHCDVRTERIRPVVRTYRRVSRPIVITPPRIRVRL